MVLTLAAAKLRETACSRSTTCCFCPPKDVPCVRAMLSKLVTSAQVTMSTALASYEGRPTHLGNTACHHAGEAPPSPCDARLANTRLRRQTDTGDDAI